MTRPRVLLAKGRPDLPEPRAELRPGEAVTLRPALGEHHVGVQPARARLRVRAHGRRQDHDRSDEEPTGGTHGLSLL